MFPMLLNTLLLFSIVLLIQPSDTIHRAILDLYNVCQHYKVRVCWKRPRDTYVPNGSNGSNGSLASPNTKQFGQHMSQAHELLIKSSEWMEAG